MTQLFNRAIIALTAAKGRRAAAQAMANRWGAAAATDRRLIGDLVQLGRLAQLPVETYERGEVIEGPICPYRLAEDRGRRALALQLIALMGVTETEIQNMMEANHDDP